MIANKLAARTTPAAMRPILRTALDEQHRVFLRQYLYHSHAPSESPIDMGNNSRGSDKEQGQQE
jgi:hypothetical protein